MSRVPYTVNIDQYICTELEYMRKMLITHDFSKLPALIEHIQFHASSMEAALQSYDDIKYSLKQHVNDKDMSDADFRAKAVEAFKRLDR